MKKEDLKKNIKKVTEKEQKVSREITPDELQKVTGGAGRFTHRKPVV